MALSDLRQIFSKWVSFVTQGECLVKSVFQFRPDSHALSDNWSLKNEGLCLCYWINLFVIFTMHADCRWYVQNSKPGSRLSPTVSDVLLVVSVEENIFKITKHSPTIIAIADYRSHSSQIVADHRRRLSPMVVAREWQKKSNVLINRQSVCGNWLLPYFKWPWLFEKTVLFHLINYLQL